MVLVNGFRQGVGVIHKSLANTNVSPKSEDELWLPVENLGREDNGFSNQKKSILNQATIGDPTISN